MKKTQRIDGLPIFLGSITTIRSVLVCLLCYCFFATNAQVSAPKIDTIKTAAKDSLITPATKKDTIPNVSTPKAQPAATPASSTDSLSKPSKDFDPLEKPKVKLDTLAKPGIDGDSTNKISMPDSARKSVGKVATDSSGAVSTDVKPADSTNLRTGAESAPDLGPGGGVAVKGLIQDENGTGLPGVSVLVKNTKIQSVTNPDGTFEMKVPVGKPTLVFSYVGFKTVEKPIGRQSVVNVQMFPESKALKEVVVVGYGAQSKRDLASSTSRVAAAEYKSAVVNTIDQALQGRTTGVQVTETSGEPGASTVVRIRGNNSLSGNNEPLYVIDGFPMPAYREAGANFTGAYTQNGLYGINPNDIESMEILKDASATAIYGSRGANGVVLITTKAGKRGEGRVELVNKTSFGQIARPMKMMNSRQYAEIMNESYALTDRKPPFENLDSALTNTDWVGAITQPSFRQDVTLSLSGGGGKSSYYISGNYLKEKGTIINSDNVRASLRANLNSEVNNWYTVKAQLAFTRQNTDRAVTASRAWPSSGGLMDGLRAAPTLPIDYLGTNSLGIPGYQGFYFSNPYNELTAKTDVTKNDYSILNVENYFKIVNGFQFVVSLGSNQNLTRRNVFLPPTTAEGNAVNGKGSNNTSNTYSYNVNAYFLYEQTFHKNHYLNATMGVEYNKQTVEFVNTNSSGFAVPYFGVDNIGSAQSQNIGSYKEQRILQSGFLRANYSFKGKYVLNTSIRVDGASPFAANKKYGVFPAVAVAWNLDGEEFMKGVKFISNTKLRASYGETGSQAIGPYSSLSQYSSAFYEMGSGAGTLGTGIYPTTIANPNLSWERTRQLNVGVDFNTAQDRLVFSVDYYNKTTNDLLQQRRVPSQAGVTSVIDNYGTMRNRGIEVSVQANVVKRKNVSYSTRLNISHNLNTLVNLGDRTQSDYVTINGNLLGGVSGILTPGQEVGKFFGYKVNRLTQPTDFNSNGIPTFTTFEGPAPPGATGTPVYGSWIYENTDGNEIIDANDRVVLGKSSPDFVFGWSHDISWKNFTVSALFTGSVGNDVLNLTSFYVNNGVVDFSGVGFNQSEKWYQNRWTEANPHNNPKYPGIQRGIASGDVNSTMVEDGSFARLKMLTLSYTFPKIGPIQNPRLFVTGTNLWTLTRYTGFDPEVSSYAQSLLQQGIDYGAYPAQKSYTIGISCNF